MFINGDVIYEDKLLLAVAFTGAASTESLTIERGHPCLSSVFFC
jgi:hypothetical protein